MTRQTGTGGDVFVDDMCVYDGAVDTTAPDPPTSPGVSGQTDSQLTVGWTAPGTGFDGGGYMVVRGTTDPTTTPNANGIYAVGNTVASGQTVVYLGTSTSFADTGLANSQTYYYRIYTVDKAFNYSSAATTSGTTLTPSGPVIVITNGGATVSVNSYDVKGTNSGVVGTMIFSNTTTSAVYTQAAPGSPFGWSQTLSSLASGVNNIVVTGTNTANVRATASTTITYNPPAPAIAITNGGVTVSVSSYDVKGTNSDIVGTMIFSNTTTSAVYTQAAPGSPFGWSQTFSSLASGANSIVVTGTNAANVRATASSTITYTPPPPATASNIVAVTTPAASAVSTIGMAVSIVTESWSNHTAQIGYGATANGSGWLWFGVTAAAGGLGYSASASFTLPIGTNYIGARWINGAITNYGWSSAGQINVTSLATPLYVVVTNTPSMLLTTPWNFANGSLNGTTCGAGMSTNFLGTYYETGFEDGAKGSYTNANVVLSNITWSLNNALIGNLANDKKINAQSDRSRHPFTNTMVDAKSGGVGTVSFKYARYGTDDPGVVSIVEYSVDGGAWSQAGSSFDSTGVDSLTDWSAALNVSGNVKIRIRSTSGTVDKRVNIDNIVLTDNGAGGSGGILAINGFSHNATRDVSSNVTFTINTLTYQTPGFYCTVRRDSTGPRKLDLDFYNGASWSDASATYELSEAGVWYTIGRSYQVAGAANTAFRLVGYGATGSELEMQGPVVTAPVPEPVLLGVAGLALVAWRVKR